MQIVTGKYNTAKVFIDNCEDTCIEQIRSLLDQEPFRDAKVRIMPDCHAGKSCVIGFTADLGDKIIPNIVGVDIGCGMLTVELGKVDKDFVRLDELIRTYVPSGREVNEGRLMRFPKIQEMRCFRELEDTRKMERAIGSLGGGNHFIEIDTDEEGNKYLVIHTGSRQLGIQVCDIYQKQAIGIHTGKEVLWDEEERIKKEYKAAGRRSEIHDVLMELHRNFRQTPPDVPVDLCFLTGKYSQNYLYDMKICQEFADENRHMIAKQIIEHYGFNPVNEFTTVHNYIDHESNIIRKGAVSAKAGEKLLIPINMRDGSLICVGKGNDDWNCSAPHGAGRLFSRTEAFNRFTVEAFEKTMKEAGIFTTCVNHSTLDESPFAYKGMDDIVGNIKPTADIIKVIKPVYNFKANSTTVKKTERQLRKEAEHSEESDE
jgi:RNA-splicing ligase RtcB